MGDWTPPVSGLGAKVLWCFYHNCRVRHCPKNQYIKCHVKRTGYYWRKDTEEMVAKMGAKAAESRGLWFSRSERGALGAEL